MLKNHCNVSTPERQGCGHGLLSAKFAKNSISEASLALGLREKRRRKSFLRAGNSYRAGNIVPFILRYLRDGTPLALEKVRRSGAQRGASENNFGQRFSVSTPCFCLLDAVEPSP
jgi:hypothetical protein